MSTQKTVRQEHGTVTDNPFRLPTETAEQIIDALNTDLAAAYVLFHQLRKHHWNVEGAEHHDLHLFLGDAAAAVEEGADALAERVQALGGVPIAGPAALEEASPVDFEGEAVYDIRTSLEHDLEMYGDIIETTREHIDLSESLGDFGSAELLREQLVELEEHAHNIDHYLEDDTLVTRDAMD